MIFKTALTKYDRMKMVILCLLLLNILSLTSLYSSLHQEGKLVNRQIFSKQVMWIGIFWAVIVICSFINYRIYFDASFALYIISIILLVAVKLFGKEVMGAQRWFVFFGFGFQPSEFSKLVTVILLARIFTQEVAPDKVFVRKVLLPLGLVSLNALLIFLQPDLGTASILLLLFFLIGFSTNIKKRFFVIILAIGLSLTPLAWNMLKEYQKQRLTVFLNPAVDPLGAGYTIIQSKIAVGSGRILGKGFLSGTQNQFNYLPERHTDFIFTVLAEEFGFAGCVFLLFIFYAILHQLICIGHTANDRFAQYLCLGIYATLFSHIVINIGMTMGLLPVVGLPLLTLSYGGTHLIITAVLMGMFFNIVRQC